jgi:hypothetical protein
VTGEYRVSRPLKGNGGSEDPPIPTYHKSDIKKHEYSLQRWRVIYAFENGLLKPADDFASTHALKPS